jgi:hypothetical protein
LVTQTIYWRSQLFESKSVSFANGDYLLLANADENQTGNGTIFFMRMRPWQDNVGLHDLPNKKQLTVYPNPATHQISIDTDEIKGIANVEIYDLTGRMVHETRQDISKTINISALQKGVYSIVITSNSHLYYSKFIKQ